MTGRDKDDFVYQFFELASFVTELQRFDEDDHYFDEKAQTIWFYIVLFV